MLCPACRTTLVPGEACRYETLDEHVMCREDVPVRGTVVCPNPQCAAHIHGVFWSEMDGEGPYNSFRKEISWIDKNPCPFDSWSRKSYFAIEYHEDDRKLKIGSLVIRREVHYESNDHGDKVGKRVHYSLWWKGAHWIPGYKMFFFIRRQLKKNAALSEEYLLREIKHTIEASEWPRAEWWRKAARSYTKWFYPTAYKKAMESLGKA